MSEGTRLVQVCAEDAPPPRSNGELVFHHPWEGRVFGLAVAAQEAGLFTAEEFRQALIAAITHAPDRPYYGSWSAALQTITVAKGLLDEQSIDQRAHAFRRGIVDDVH